MQWAYRAIHLFRRLIHRKRVEEELHEEVATYFEIMVERGTARGLTRAEAERAARVAFEGPLQVAQKVREVRVGAALETMWQDVRFAVRVLSKSPAFTFFAVVTVALGLGANAAIFSLVNGVLLKSSGYPEPERIVALWEKPPGYPRNAIAAANYIDWANQNQCFESIAAQTGGTMTYTGTYPAGGEPRSVRVGFVSASYFDVFGAKAALGRTFAKDEDQPGKEKVVVLTHRLWWNQFGGDPAAAGREILLD